MVDKIPQCLYEPWLSLLMGPLSDLVIVRRETETQKKRRNFGFEAMWVGDTECQKIIKNYWNFSQSKTPLVRVMEATKICSKNLVIWNKEKFRNVQWKLRDAKNKLQLLQRCDPL